MSSPYRIPAEKPAEKPVIRKIELTEKEIRAAIARFISDESLMDGWDYDESSLNFYFKCNGNHLNKPLLVLVQKEEKIPGLKY